MKPAQKSITIMWTGLCSTLLKKCHVEFFICTARNSDFSQHAKCLAFQSAVFSNLENRFLGQYFDETKLKKNVSINRPPTAIKRRVLRWKELKRRLATCIQLASMTPFQIEKLLHRFTACWSIWSAFSTCRRPYGDTVTWKLTVRTRSGYHEWFTCLMPATQKHHWLNPGPLIYWVWKKKLPAKHTNHFFCFCKINRVQSRFQKEKMILLVFHWSTKHIIFDYFSRS